MCADRYGRGSGCLERWGGEESSVAAMMFAVDAGVWLWLVAVLVVEIGRGKWSAAEDGGRGWFRWWGGRLRSGRGSDWAGRRAIEFADDESRYTDEPGDRARIENGDQRRGESRTAAGNSNNLLDDDLLRGGENFAV